MAENKIHEVLCALEYGLEMQKKINQAFAPAKVYHVKFEDDETIRSIIDRVDVAVLPTDLDERILAGSRLKWVHCCHAGLTLSARKEVFDRGILLSGGAGRSAPSLAEHTFFFALALTYGAFLLKEEQENKDWHATWMRYAYSRGMNGKIMGIIGLGHTGMAVAKRAKAFDMRVIAYSRRKREILPENVDACYAQDAGEGFEVLLKESDYIVLCCNLSDETYHLIGKEELAMMKDSAFLINMARGQVVDQDALYGALRDKVIAGAGCDVFNEEPLPPLDPLWELPNIIITPHATPHVADRAARSTDALFENIEKYKRGDRLVNQFDLRDIYTK